MGLIKALSDAIKEKAKEEMIRYLRNVVENKEEEKKKEAGAESGEKKEEEAVPVKQEKLHIEIKEKEPEKEVVSAPAPQEQKQSEQKQREKEKEVPAIFEEDILRYNLSGRGDQLVMSRLFLSDIQTLDLDEFALYLKLYAFCFNQKKNFGYLGNSLRRNLGLDELSSRDFGRLIRKLEKRGLITVYSVSDNQNVFILYMPFDEGYMKLVEEKKPVRKQQKPHKKETKQEPSPVAVEPQSPSQPDTLPGRAGFEMDEDALKKAYLTYVSLEIDKAKLRVGRSSFDKIYMEAVKYIDKKYGFKVLSDSEKFKEYLTQYYISAFDIPSYDTWKKNKQ